MRERGGRPCSVYFPPLSKVLSLSKKLDQNVQSYFEEDQWRQRGHDPARSLQFSGKC